MTNIERYFKEHPESVGETYVDHAKVASGIGWLMIKGGLACIVHAIFPFWFTTTASRMIRRLRFIARARRPIAQRG